MDFPNLPFTSDAESPERLEIPHDLYEASLMQLAVAWGAYETINEVPMRDESQIIERPAAVAAVPLALPGEAAPLERPMAREAETNPEQLAPNLARNDRQVVTSAAPVVRYDDQQYKEMKARQEIHAEHDAIDAAQAVSTLPEDLRPLTPPSNVIASSNPKNDDMPGYEDLEREAA